MFVNCWEAKCVKGIKCRILHESFLSSQWKGIKHILFLFSLLTFDSSWNLIGEKKSILIDEQCTVHLWVFYHCRNRTFSLTSCLCNEEELFYVMGIFIYRWLTPAFVFVIIFFLKNASLSTAWYRREESDKNTFLLASNFHLTHLKRGLPKRRRRICETTEDYMEKEWHER